MNDGEFNLEERILCEDDACIGLVGQDGKCKVCGRLYQGPLPLLSGNTDLNVDKADSTSDGAEDSDRIQPESSIPEIDDRVLCPDDTCIGIIGPDGKCGTCGKSA